MVEEILLSFLIINTPYLTCHNDVDDNYNNRDDDDNRDDNGDNR